MVGVVSIGSLIFMVIRFRERPPREAIPIETLRTQEKKLVLAHLVTAVVYLLIGGTFGAAVGSKLLAGPLTLLDPRQFYMALTAHSVATVYGWAILGTMGVSYYFVPNLLGVSLFSPGWARLSYWLLNAGILISILSFSDALYTFSVPLEVPLPYLLGQMLAVLAFYIFGFNILATYAEGVKGKKYTQAPLFVIFLTLTALMLAAGSAIYFAFLALLLSKLFIMPTITIDPLFAQNMFWFFFHPILYALIFPVAGALCYYVPQAAGRPLKAEVLNYKVAVPLYVVSTLTVWLYHLITAPLPLWSKLTFGQLSSWALIIPTSITFLSAYLTLFLGRPTVDWSLKTKLLFTSTLAWLYGGMLGSALAIVPVNPLLHNTLVIPAHFHLMMLGTFSLAMFAIIADLWPKLSGRELMSEGFGDIHFYATSLGVFGVSTVMFLGGLFGMRRRVYEDIVRAQDFWILMLFLLILIVGLAQYGYGYKMFRNFYDATGIRRRYGIVGIILGVAVANLGLYGFIEPKLAMTAMLSVALLIFAGAIIFFSLAIVLGEMPTPAQSAAK